MHVRRALALTLVILLLLAGCSDEPEPTPKIPEPTTSSATPTPTASETPEAESAEEFIRRWSEALRKMQVTGQTQDFEALNSDCESCAEAAERITSIYQGGGTVQWAGYKILEIQPYGKALNQYRVEIDSAPTRLRETPTGRWQRLPGGRITRLIELESVDGDWLMARTAELAG